MFTTKYTSQVSKVEQPADYFETLENPISSQYSHSEVAVDSYASANDNDASNEVLAVTAILALGVSVVALSVGKKIKEKTGGATLKEYFWASFAERHGFLASQQPDNNEQPTPDSVN